MKDTSSHQEERIRPAASASLKRDTASMYQPVKIARSYEHIVAQIENLITSGQLQIGDKLLGERELAEQFEVSRVVVREAMRDLEARGIIKARQGSGTYIAMAPSLALTRSLTLLLKLDKPALIDLMIARKALEEVTAPLAAQRATEEQFAALKQCVEEMSVIAQQGLHLEENFYAYSQGDLKFHLIIAQASHNSTMETLLSAILPLVKTGRFEVIKRLGSFEKFRAQSETQALQHAEHINIANAVFSREAEAARELMLAHLDRIIDIYSSLS